MFARLALAVLVLALLSGLAATLALARTPIPTPTATVSASATPTATARTATPTPFVTPVGCGFFAYTPTPGAAPPSNPTAPGGPAPPSDLRAELVDDPELVSGLAVQLTWEDNADNETCFGVAVRIDGEHAGVAGLSPGLDGSTTGPVSTKDFPDQTGLHCYQVYYGNAAGQSHSNEVCIDVETVAVRLEATPPPPGCQGQGPIGAPGTPNAPVNLRAEIVPGAGPVAGQVIRLTWDDNATNDLCYTVERTVGPGAPGARYVWDRSPASVGPVFYEEIPDHVGRYCYRVDFGNEAGRSPYSNEACVDVKAVPEWRTPTPVGCDFPTPTPGPGATPFPTASVPPAAPSDLRAELVPDPRLEAGLAVELTWQDNADNDACYFMEVRIDGELKRGWGVMLAEGGSATGANTWRDIPDRTGTHCYRIYYGNSVGRAYSNEACVSVEVLPVRVTATPIVATTTPATAETPTWPTVVPSPPPWPCALEDPPYSELGPAAPTNLVVTLIADASISSGYKVELTWKDNATDVLCFKAQSRLADGTWHWFTGGTGSAEIAVDAEALPGECYRVWVANEHGRSAYSNEACATGPAVTRTATSTPAGLHATPAATALMAQAAAVGALPATGGVDDGGGLAWWLWAVAAAGSVLLIVTALSLVRVARRRR